MWFRPILISGSTDRHSHTRLDTYLTESASTNRPVVGLLLLGEPAEMERLSTVVLSRKTWKLAYKTCIVPLAIEAVILSGAEIDTENE